MAGPLAAIVSKPELNRRHCPTVKASTPAPTLVSKQALSLMVSNSPEWFLLSVDALILLPS
jgi:hypothetical protein